MSHRVLIEATSRLHFGLLSFGQSNRRQYGGVGLMVEAPGSVLLAEAAERFSVSGPQAGRLQEFAERWRQSAASAEVPPCHLRLLRSAPEHVGLGTGTQLGLSVAAALYRLADLPLPDAATLAGSVERGLRSSVGTHGFLHGGLIFDVGKVIGESLGPLGARVELPDAWRVVQICPARRTGLSGAAEKRAFRQLPPVPPQVTDRLLRIIQEQLLPAAGAADLDALGEAIFRYGYEAGLCFAAQQGGPFASPELAAWIEALRRRNIRGVGQTSWGPTLFALTNSPEAADELREWAGRDLPLASESQLRVSRIANHGARCVVAPASATPCDP